MHDGSMLAADPPAIAAPAEPADHSDVIEIVGSRADQALKIDRRTFEVQQNPHTAQKDSVQLLRGLPAVTIAPDDTIMLLGAPNVTIQIDGRAVSNPNTIAYLRTLHGSDIERIEVITNPSAQYSATGTGGIINFVLRKKQEEGASGNVSSEVTSLGHAYVDASLKSKRGKWTYEFGAGGRVGTGSRSTYHKLRSIEAALGETRTINTEDGGSRSRGTEGEGNAKVTYELDPKTSVSAKILAASARDINDSHAEFTGLTQDFRSFSQRQHFTTTASFLLGELNFDHKGSKEGETLGASLRLFDIPNQHEAGDADFSDGGTYSTDKRKHLSFVTGQADWQHPMYKGQILSLGAKWEYSRMSERYRFTSLGSDGLLGTEAADQFRGIENNLAAYATFQQPMDDWTVMPGVRIERNSRHITSPGERDLRITHTDLFPTLHIDRSLTKAVDLTLSYSKRIDRPQLNDLRPYSIVQDVLTLKTGNPRLKDQSTDSYEINLHYRRKKLDAGLIIYDRETSHLRSQSYSVVNEINVFTFVNSGHSRDRGAEFDISTPVVRHVKLMASVNLFDQRMPADTPSVGMREMFRYTANGTLEWDGPDRGKTPGDVAQLQWIYNSPWRQFQLHYPEWNQLSLSYTHSFSRAVSLTGTANYNAPNRHSLLAPLVQEYYSARSPAEFKIKLSKTFGSSK
jgi:outer membrane receptor protein involved in Fe transport